ncbi:MAG: energy-coupled thiamine transporter ThiT, partial [Clostridia bacterium]|nr:energy-coupled thiamine transporter ThiT [Clostridia bacterium]
VIYHPMSILLDYVLAFGLIGVCGFFKPTPLGIVLGTLSGVGCRFISSLVSGAVLFGSYAPAGQNPWVYSFIYQCTYMIPELVICFAIMLLITFKAKNLIKV